MITITTCRFCASRCGIIVERDNERPVRIKGDPDHPVSRGWSCARGRAAMVKQYTGKFRPVIPSL